jgi:hypothetical protein
MVALETVVQGKPEMAITRIEWQTRRTVHILVGMVRSDLFP